MLFLQNTYIVRKDNRMHEELIQSVLYACCLGFAVTCLQFLMRNSEIDRKRELLIGVSVWVVASTILLLFFISRFE